MLTGDYAGRVSLQCSKLSGENSPDNRPQLHQVCSVSVDQRPSSEGQMIRAVTCWRLLLDDLVEFELLLLELFTVDAAHGGTNHRYPLLVVDEVGYIPFEPEAANLFFQLVSSRYERASLNADPGLVRQFEGVADHVGISKDTALDQALSAWIAEHSGKGSQIRWKATPATN